MARPRSEQPPPGDLEVLRVLWRRGPATVRDVMDELNRTRPRAYTSVMSLLNVMVTKGFLRRKSAGRAYLYTARTGQERTLRQLVRDMVARAFAGSPQELVVHLLEETQPTPQQLDDLRRLLDEYRRRQEGTDESHPLAE